MTNPTNDKPPRPEERDSTEAPKTISAGDLFEGQREILIEHEGETYRLRITRRNKLILQK
jgi:hemin uptake protein HemP